MPGEIADAAEFLADVRALEAAGAEMVLIEGDGVEQQILLGAIAAVTHRIRLRLPNGEVEAILQKLSRGRSGVGQPVDETWISGAMPGDPKSVAGTIRDTDAPGMGG